jgi:hypothetical protein
MRTNTVIYDISTQCVAFVGDTLLAAGRLDEVVAIAKQAFDDDSAVSSWVFDATTSARIDVDLGGQLSKSERACQTPPMPLFVDPAGRNWALSRAK